MSRISYRQETLRLDGGARSTAHIVEIPADRLRFEDLHPMSSYLRQQDIARMFYARARGRGEESPQILTWTAMQTDRRASQLFPDLDHATDDGEQLLSANSFIAYALRTILERGWLQLHEYISDTYEWKLDIPAGAGLWRARGPAIARWLEESIQLDLYPNVERGSYRPRLFRPFDASRNFARIGRCDFIRHFAQHHDRQVVFNTSHFLHEHADLISHHSGYGDAIGLMVAEGTILRPPIYRRGALLHDGERWRVAMVSLEDIQLVLPGELSLGCASESGVRLDLNPSAPADFALFTRAGALPETARPLECTPLERDRLEFVLVNRQILSWKRGGGLRIPQNGFVLSLAAGALTTEETRRIVADAWVEYEFAAEAMAGTRSAIQAGPILLRAGKDGLEEAAASEEFCASHEGAPGITPVRMDLRGASQRKARTAIGLRADGDLVLLLIDGCDIGLRGDEDSAGATLEETCQILLSIGAGDALNLSGEGSSHLFVAGGLANRPSDRRGRAGVVYERMLPSIGIAD